MQYLSRSQLARWLCDRGYRVSVATLETWASRNNDGPPFYKRGRWVVYRVSDVEAWLDAKTSGPFTSTSAMSSKA